MEQISGELYLALRREDFSPFSIKFEINQFKQSIQHPINKKDAETIFFVEYCNSSFKEFRSYIFQVFETLNISPIQLRNLFFSAINKTFLDTHPRLISQMSESGTAFEIEKSAFYKYTTESGQIIDANTLVELGGDVLGKLILLSHEWEKSISQTKFINSKDINDEDLGKLFNIAWFCSNALINIEGSAFDIVAFENGDVTFKENDSQIRVATGFKGIHFLKNAGYLRSTNNINEVFMPLNEVYKKGGSTRIGVKSIKYIQKNIKIEWGKTNDYSGYAKAIAQISIFQPHFFEKKLKLFNEHTLLDLTEILLLLEEIIHHITNENLLSYKELSLKKTPIKIDCNHLVDFLINCTGKKKKFILEVLETLIVSPVDFYFWKSPLMKEGNDYLLSIPVLIAPNHSLFFDKWTEFAGYTISQKSLMFKSFLKNDLFKNGEITFLFHEKSNDDLKLPLDSFNNSIFIETADFLLLLEVVVYDFPVESNEINEVMKQLGHTSTELINKLDQIPEKENLKPIFPILISNYSLFSGVTMNGITLVDYTLFKNYFFVGKYRKAVVSYETGSPIVTDTITFPYYTDESEFNKNLISFFNSPPPIELITQRFCWEEQIITPEIMNISIVVDKIEHIEEGKLLDKKINSLAKDVNYKYFDEPDEKDKKSIDFSIDFSLELIFHQLAHAPYESLSKRVDTYRTLEKTKQIGFFHLIKYINETIPKFNNKKIKKKETFDSVPYNLKTVFKLLKEKGSKLNGQIRFSELSFENEFSLHQEKQIISFALNYLNHLGAKKFSNKELNDLYLPLALLMGLSHKHQIKFEIYAVCGNFIDTLNFNHKFQDARDFCEEFLVFSIKRKEPYYGWGILFKCFTSQNNQFEAAMNGCIYIASMLGLSDLPYDLALDLLYSSLKFFRNFRFNGFMKNMYESLKHFPLEEYDEQKISLSYFNSLLQGPIDEEPESLNEIIDYLEKKQTAIIEFGDKGITPWLVLLYNIKRLVELEYISFNREYFSIIKKLEASSDPIVVKNIRSMVLGDGKNTKVNFIKSLLNIRETRDSSDYVYEIKQLKVASQNLVLNSLNPVDYDGLFLAGFILNDHTLVFNNIYLDLGTVSPVYKNKDSDFEKILNKYSNYISENIPLKKGQLFVWIFDNHKDVFALTINFKTELTLNVLEDWNIKSMDKWVNKLPFFYFNSQKKSYYDIGEQECDHKLLLQEISFAKMNINQDYDELLVATSIELSGFPTNLLIQDSNFISCSKPISNVISAEWMVKFGGEIKLKNNWTSSAWVPIEDGDGTVNWGYDKILPILNNLGTKIHTSHYPSSSIKSDINIFLAHGELESSGFKAIYTNEGGESAILYPKAVFGSGTIAILFICNSGSTKEDFFSNSVSSFSMQLLNDGYKSVIAPFWPFDVAISPIWLKEFIKVFQEGFAINQAVFLANQKVSEYDEESSACYYSPEGRLAMHLYGNPNVFIEV